MGRLGYPFTQPSKMCSLPDRVVYICCIEFIGLSTNANTTFLCLESVIETFEPHG